MSLLGGTSTGQRRAPWCLSYLLGCQARTTLIAHGDQCLGPRPQIGQVLNSYIGPAQQPCIPSSAGTLHRRRTPAIPTIMHARPHQTMYTHSSTRLGQQWTAQCPHAGQSPSLRLGRPLSACLNLGNASMLLEHSCQPVGRLQNGSCQEQRWKPAPAASQALLVVAMHSHGGSQAYGCRPNGDGPVLFCSAAASTSAGLGCRAGSSCTVLIGLQGKY